MLDLIAFTGVHIIITSMIIGIIFLSGILYTFIVESLLKCITDITKYKNLTNERKNDTWEK